MRRKRKKQNTKKDAKGLNSLLFTLGLASLFVIVGIIYQFLLKHTDSINNEEINNRRLISKLKLDIDRLNEEYEHLCSNEEILKLAKKYYGNNIKQATPKGVIYISENN